eukprot:jgi/Picsp_1/1204/NSC_04685-R1_---NA---
MDSLPLQVLQSAWEHHRALIRCICTIGGAVDSIEYLKKIQYGGMDERMKDIRACLEGHKEYTSELDVSLSKVVRESDGGKQSVLDVNAMISDACRAQYLIMKHFDGLDSDLNELERLYSGLTLGESKDTVIEEEKECLMLLANALDILQEDFSILGPVARASSVVTLPEEMEAYESNPSARMKKSRSLVQIGKGKRRRRGNPIVDDSSLAKEKMDVNHILLQRDMVKYSMNDILCGKNEESLAASLAGMEKACWTVKEALEQKAMVDGQDSVSMYFMHSMWSTIQYCMNAYLNHGRDKKTYNDDSMEEAAFKAIQMVYSTAKPYVNRLKRIDTLLESLTFMIQVEDLMTRPSALSSSILGKKTGSMSWTLSEAIELVGALEEHIIGNNSPCPKRDEQGEVDSTFTYHMPIFQTYLRAAEHASLHDGMELVGNNSVSKAMAVMRHPRTLEEDAVLMKQYLVDFFLERAMRQPATGGNLTQGLSDCSQAIQLAEDALCSAIEAEGCAEISSKLEMTKILNSKFLYRLERHEEALKMIHFVDLACIKDVEEQQDVAFMVSLIRARIYVGVRKFDDAFNELVISARLLPGMQVKNRTVKMEEFADCFEKVLAIAEGTVEHAAEAAAAFLKLNHGSSSFILGVISRLDHMMANKKHMVSEERFNPFFQVLADDFVRSALTKDEIGRESCYGAFQRAAAVAFGEGKLKESLEFLQACLHYGQPVRKQWTNILMAALYLHSKNYEMAHHCIQKAELEGSATEPVGHLVHLLYAIEKKDDDMEGLVGRRIAQDCLQWTEDEWIALAEVASHSHSAEAMRAVAAIQKRLWPEDAKLVQEIVQVTELCQEFSTSAITVSDFTDAIERSLYEISDHVEELSRFTKDSRSPVQITALFNLAIGLLLSLDKARSQARAGHEIVIEVKILTASYFAMQQLIGLLSVEKHGDKLRALLKEEIRILALLFDLYIRMHNGHHGVPGSNSSLKRARDIYLQIKKRIQDNNWIEEHATFLSFMDAIISFSSDEAAKLGQWLLRDDYAEPEDSTEVTEMGNFWLKMCSFPNVGSSVVRIVVERFAAEISCTEEGSRLISKHFTPLDKSTHALCLISSKINRELLPPIDRNIQDSLEESLEHRSSSVSHKRMRHMLPWVFSSAISEVQLKQEDKLDCLDGRRQPDTKSPTVNKRLKKSSQDSNAFTLREGSNRADGKESPDAEQASTSEEEQSENSPLKNLWRMCTKRMFK